jgi:hypothetical protein
MGTSFVFAFAPVPLTNEQSPLVHAALIVRRHQEQLSVVAEPRYRIKPAQIGSQSSRIGEKLFSDALKVSTDGAAKV